MHTPYAFVIELEQPLGPAVEALREALAAEQMGIVSEFDVQAALKAQLSVDGPPHKLLGLCSPKVARALLVAEPEIGALLPCGCSVAERSPGHTRIALQDPRMIAAASGAAEVRAACELARAALRRVTDRLAALA